jgi:MFS transporter, FSR family, fosmidomycin resistance protein
MEIAGELKEGLPTEQPQTNAKPSPEKFQAARVITIAAGHWIHDSYAAFLSPLLIIFKQNLGLTNAEAGLLVVFMQEASLAQPLVGGLADRFNMRYFVILAPAITGIFMSLLGLSTNYWTLAIFLTIVGLSSACLHAVGPVLTGNVSGKRIGTGMSIWMVGGEAGRFFGPVVLATALPLLTMQRIPWLMIGGLITSVLLFFTLQDDPTAWHQSKQAGVSFRQAIAGKGKLVAVLLVFIIVQVLMSAALSTYLPLLLNGKGETFTQASIAFAIYQAAGVLGAFLGGTLSDKLGRRLMLVVAVVPTAVFMFVLLGSLSQASLAWTRIPALLVLGFSSLSITPVVMAMVLESFPKNRAMANGAYMALSFLIRSVAVVILGGLGDRFGLSLSFAVSALVPLAGLPVLMFLPNRLQPAETNRP